MRKIIAVLIIFIVTQALPAQIYLAVPFLEKRPSANLFSNGGAYAALPTNDPAGFYYNPAQLGYFSQDINGVVQISSSKYLPWSKFHNYAVYNGALSAGVNYQNANDPLPFSLGIGYMLGYASIGKRDAADGSGSYRAKDIYHAIGIGTCIDYFIKTSLGLTYKKIVSELPSSYNVENRGDYGHASAWDIGILTTIPIADLLLKKKSIFGSLYTIFDISFGYSIVNIGDEVFYRHPDFADPLPREARLGNAVQLGLRKEFKGANIEIFKIEYSSESNDILAKTGDNGFAKYQGIFGDLNVTRALLLWDDNKEVTLRQGVGIRFFEILKISMGFIDHANQRFQKPFGFSLSYKGIRKLKALLSNSNHVDNFDFQFAYTRQDISRNFSIFKGGITSISFRYYFEKHLGEDF